MSRPSSWSNDTPRQIPTPALIADVDLLAPIEPITLGSDYRAARLLVRVHGRPVGYVDLTADLATPIDLDRILAALGPDTTARALRHLAALGLPAPTSLAAALGMAARHPCASAPLRDGPLATVAICTRDRAHLVAHVLDLAAAPDLRQHGDPGRR